MRLLQSLTRGLNALDYMGERNEPVRLTDVASALGVEKSNASHVLKTLVAAGFASQDANRRYRVTDKIAVPNRHSHSLEEIVACKEAWRPALLRLVAETGECAYLAVLMKAQVWYIDKIDSTLPLKVDHPIGSLAPLHCTALGKTFLAFGPGEPEEELQTFTDKTITSPARLREEMQKVRQRGYAVDDEEFAPGIRCVARPIYDAQGRMIAAMGVSGPTVRIDAQRLKELGHLVESACNDRMEELAG